MDEKFIEETKFGVPVSLKKQWENHDWSSVLDWDEQTVLDFCGFDSYDEVCEYILYHVGLRALYQKSDKTRAFLLKRGMVAPFIEGGNWLDLFKGGYSKSIDLEDWWQTKPNERNLAMDCAVSMKNWDFLENHVVEDKRCLKLLMRNWRLMRAYRAWCLSEC